jgi:hypothetical protein
VDEHERVVQGEDGRRYNLKGYGCNSIHKGKLRVAEEADGKANCEKI